MRTPFLFFILTAVFCNFVVAQGSGSISGRVTDFEDNGAPLLFARVSLKNTAISEQTNFHGNFEILGVEPGNYVLAISYLGYETKEFPIQVKANRITLIEKELKAITLNSPSLHISESEATMGKISPGEVTSNRPF